jgi:hypothetical protein
MKQDARKLLSGTVVFNEKINDVGVLCSLRSDIYGQLNWLIDWSIRGLLDEPIEQAQKYSLDDLDATEVNP